MGSTTIPITQPPTRPGPLINNQPTTLTLLTKTQLSTSPYLPSLFTTANLAYRTQHSSRPDLRMNPTKDARLASAESFLDELSDDPGTFVFVVTYVGAEEVLATATCRRYFGVRRSGNVSPWTRTLDVEVGCVEWELKLMAVRPELQGRGVAGWILGECEGEVLRRSRAEFEVRRDGGGVRIEAEGKGEGMVEIKGAGDVERVKMVICTPREVLGEWYAKRGYVKDYEVERGEGMNFHIIFMAKILGTLV